MMKKLLAVFFLLPFISCGQQQEENIVNMDGVDCGIHGSSSPDRKEYVLNEYKNRYKLPAQTDFAVGISLSDLIKAVSANYLPQDSAVILTGYVFNVKMGGVESCNCKTKDPVYRDTHIELVPDAEHTGPEYRVIVEVTPRLRAMMAAKGIDWSTETLKQTLKGHKARITGWLFFDSEHEKESFANDPDGEKDWRATCWEIHPITNIELLD